MLLLPRPSRWQFPFRRIVDFFEYGSGVMSGIRDLLIRGSATSYELATSEMAGMPRHIVKELRRPHLGGTSLGYLDRVPSSRRLERECQRNIEMIWLTGQLAPDFKTMRHGQKPNRISLPISRASTTELVVTPPLALSARSSWS
jgi:transposase-like protein DUF772